MRFNCIFQCSTDKLYLCLKYMKIWNHLKMKKIVIATFPKKIVERLRYYNWIRHILFHRESYLHQTGYLKSFRTFKPIDKDNNPLPWMNYAVIEFLSKRLNKSINVFEYGSGYSTIYFSKLVNKITSIEYNTEWFEKIGTKLNTISNVELSYVLLDKNYSSAIEDITPKKQKYEFIIIDGRKRVECAKKAIKYFTPDGILLLDDSNRERYKDVFRFYLKNGFRELTFSGIKPNGLEIFYTTLFYRSKNVFDI